ncbi:hypothetical protein HYW75_04785, partial [Candidatus Pacearchaeota archaeon]|nr:hypothetical protein [Candidatus Pacearchaeota archaeon]
MELYPRKMLTKRFFILFLLLFIGGFSFVSAADFHPTINPENMGRFGMGNPAVAYCKELGYKFANIENEGGETSVCIFSEDITVKNITNGDVKNENSSQVLFCDGWEFFQGKCGAEYSYCSKNGYGIKTLEDGANSLSDKYAVCILNSSSSNQEGLMRAQTNAGKSEISVDELMNLDDKISIKASVDSFNSSENEVGFDGRKSDDLQRSNMITNANGLAATPSSFDWRTKDGKNWMSSVKSQGSCGSCWAFGAVAGVESKIKIAKNDPNFEVDLAEQHLVSSCSNAGDCDGGWHYLALDFVKNSGIVDELCYPYTATDSQCSAICSSFEQRLWKIDGYNKITGGRETIKEFLVEKGPLPTAILMSGSFDSNGIYRCNNPQWINHVVVLTGYDDIGGYWIAKNSWGTNWGNSGYFKIGYGECNVEMMPYYIELEESSGSNKIIGNNIRVSPGSVSGSLSSTSEKDGAYMTLTESCSGFGCSGLNANITFSTTSLSNVQSMDVVAYHRGRNEDGFSVRYSDLNQNKVINLGSVPDSKWGLAKFRICNSIEECSAYLLKNLTINYFHPSCSFCNTDNVDIDLLSLEFVNDQYCQAETTSSSFEYISRVELNGAESNSGSSTYSDFTDSSLASLNRGGTYTIFVNGATSGNYSEHVKAWIDFNNNKELNSGEEIDLGSFIFFGEHTFSGTFAVPTDSILADVRMRVYLKFGSSPTQCEKADFGEVEDYVISIISDTTPPSM